MARYPPFVNTAVDVCIVSCADVDHVVAGFCFRLNGANRARAQTFSYQYILLQMDCAMYTHAALAKGTLVVMFSAATQT